MIPKDTNCIWLTGLSGSGKTTISKILKSRLDEINIPSVLLDGDIIRKGLNKSLGFREDDRKENIRRVAEISKIIISSKVNVICAFISPTIELREIARSIIGKEHFIEVFVKTPLEICIERDPKGLYAKALKGEIKNFTGLDAVYEPPVQADLTINTCWSSPNQSTAEIFELIGTKLEPENY